MKKQLRFCLALLMLHATLHAQTIVKNMSSANGYVYSVYKKGNAYYIGGDFNYVGLNTGYAALTKTTNDYPNMDFPQFNGQVYALISDGANGWYAGGNFTTAGGVSKSYLAHIKGDNTVDAAFNANCNSTVRTIYKLGTRLYIGGNFTTVNGTARYYAAAVNATTGAIVNGWNPSPSGQINTISAAIGTDTAIWLGGNFQYINTSNLLRPYLVKVNTTNGSFISGSVSADNVVNKITVKGDSVFVGGSFSRLGLKTDYLSNVQEGSSNSDQTMPNTNGSVRCIIPDGTGGWYVGGYFTQIGGVSKSCIAHIKSNKTVDAAFTATCNSWVYSIVKDGSKLYLGGAFSNVNTTPRNYLAAVNASTGALVTGWDPNANSYVYSLALRDSVIIAGGLFTNIGGQNALRFGVINKISGVPVGGFPGYNSTVQKVSVINNDSIVTGGNYTLSALYSPYSSKLTTSNVKPDPKFPATNGTIYAVAKDASGNYYVGGSFTVIGGVNQAYIAKLNSSFQVITGWAPSVVGGAVRSIILSGTTVYIGGQFYQTNAVSRTYISALNTANPGSNKTWNSSLNSYVYSLVTDGTSIYAGGQFTQVNGSTARGLLAKFNLTGNLDATWNPNAAGGGGWVNQLAISGTNVLAGGSFTTIGGVSRNYLAKLNNTNGSAVNWATANSYVFSLFVEGTTCYVGGYFNQLTSTGGSATARNYIGGITISTGNIATYNPSPNSYVYAINKSGTNLYFGGQFSQVGGTARNYLASTNTSGALQSWNPSANGTVNAINVDGSNLFIGGSFSGFQEASRSYASIIKYPTQALAPWSPVVDGVVYDIAYNSSKIFIGGTFHTVNGAARNGFAALNRNGVLQGTNLNLTKNGGTSVGVYSLFATTNKIYVGGDFDKAGTSFRNDFVEADITSGAGTISPTSVNADNIIYDIDVQGTTITYGGDFRFSNFVGKNYLAIIRNTTGNVAPWQPLPDYSVFDIALNYNKIFIVGQFDNVAGAPHPGAAAFNLSTGVLTTWNPNLTRAGYGVYADLNAVLADSNYVYLGGFFDKVNGTTRNNAAIVAATNAALQSWDAGPNYIVRAMALKGTNLFIGGDFTFCKGAARSYIAKIDSATGLVNTSWNPGSNGSVYAITGSGSTIYAGGSFTQFAGVTRTSLAAVSTSTGALASFDPVIQQGGGAGTVYSLRFDSLGTLYAGGQFTTAKGSARNNAAAFTVSGSGTLKSWNPNTNGIVYALMPAGSNVYLGGSFTTVGGTTRNYLASVNNTTGAITGFNPNMNSYVRCLALGVNIIYAGGQFTTVAGGGTSRSYLSAYDATTGALKSWNPISNSYVLGIAAQKDTIYVGGYLTTLNGVSRDRLGAVRNAGGTANLAFNPGMNNIVQNNFIADNTLLTGGSFTTVGGTYRGYFAVFKLPGNSSLKADDNNAIAENSIAGTLQNAVDAFTVYPNPAHSSAILKFSKVISGKIVVSVADINGKALLQKTLQGDYLNYIKLDLSTFKSGTYNITVTANGYHQSGFLIVTH